MNPIPNEEYWRRVHAQRQQDNPADDPDWRVLVPIGTRAQVDTVLDLMAKKGLTKFDIALILVTFRLHPGQNISTLIPSQHLPEMPTL